MIAEQMLPRKAYQIRERDFLLDAFFNDRKEQIRN